MPSRSRRLLQLEDCAVARLEHAARAALVAEVVELVGVPDVIAVGRGVQRVAAVVAQIPLPAHANVRLLSLGAVMVIKL